MRTAKSSLSLGLAAMGLAVLAPAGAAVADPKKGDSFTITCGNGVTYEVTTPPANGAFTPALDVNSNTVLIPVVFEGFRGTAILDGEVVVSFEDDAQEVKGSGKQRGLTRCVARFEETVYLTEEEAAAEGLPPVAGTYTFIGEGAVLGQIRGR